MIKSMTGFGRYENTTEEYKLTVEIKSVNHKYCDISIKMPKKLNQFEVAIRTLLKEYIKRGNVDVFITYEDYAENNLVVKYSKNMAKEYIDALNSIGEDFSLSSECSAAMISRYPEVLTLEEQSGDVSAAFARVEEGIRYACERFVESRVAEGSNLKNDLLEKLDNLSALVDYIVERSPKVVEEYREKIYAKVAELLGNTKLDESILATEITIYADKICVDEEMVRLKSHIAGMKSALDEADCVGRKLDFYAQELNREANTTLSKSGDIDITNKAIELKTEIEKIREQIQNIE